MVRLQLEVKQKDLEVARLKRGGSSNTSQREGLISVRDVIIEENVNDSKLQSSYTEEIDELRKEASGLSKSNQKIDDILQNTPDNSGREEIPDLPTSQHKRNKIRLPPSNAKQYKEKSPFQNSNISLPQLFELDSSVKSSFGGGAIATLQDFSVNHEMSDE